MGINIFIQSMSLYYLFMAHNHSTHIRLCDIKKENFFCYIFLDNFFKPYKYETELKEALNR